VGVWPAQRPGRAGEMTLGRSASKRHQVFARLRGGPQQLRGVERRSDATDALTERRQDADRNVAEAAIVLERASQLGAGDAGTLDVDQERAGSHAERNELERGTAVPCAEHVGADRRQMIADRVAGLALVVDQDDRMAMPAHPGSSIGI
jgi:hypothetical protein